MAKKKSNKPLWLVWLEYVPAMLLLPAIRWFPYRLGTRLSRGVGHLLYYLLPTYRKVAIINLGLAFGTELPPAEARRIARGAFAALVQTLFEFVALSRLSKSQILRYTGEAAGYARYRELVAEGRGVIACSAHLANWYWTLVCAAFEGFQVNVVIRPLDNPRLDRLMRSAMERWGIRVIPRSQVVPAAISALRRGETVALMVDQNAAVGGRFAPFFGLPAATMRGLWMLRQGTGAALICVHDERMGPLHRAVVRELTDLPDEETACLTRVNRHFEAAIRAQPDQYLWLHPRWKTRPPGEPSLYPNLSI